MDYRQGQVFDALVKFLLEHIATEGVYLKPSPTSTRRSIHHHHMPKPLRVNAHMLTRCSPQIMPHYFLYP